MTSKSVDKNNRLLALDVRPRRFGYAVLEAPARLVDFGVTRFDSPHAGVRRVAALMAKYRPSVLVQRKAERPSTRNRPAARAVTRIISRKARNASIKVVFIGDKQMKISLGGSRTMTKHQIASLLARAFAELAWRLPQPRKSWQPERWNMLIFDATAIGVTYLVTKKNESLIKKLAFAS